MSKIILFAVSISLLISCNGVSMKTIEVFHKNKNPSLQTLEKVNVILMKYKDKYKISYHLITDSENMDLIEKYNLPETHFPFAIVINRKYSAKLEDEKIHFVHFPHFMHGIGRHEGNWSLADLETVLKNNLLLLDKNILPEREEDNNEPCEDEIN
ncbi:MAG: hypothetical protein H8E33_03860 [Candidatus Cloacimonetes bacterium]|nr:hypothetical protein [Candidatus Cloacimonadota bacterium]